MSAAGGGDQAAIRLVLDAIRDAGWRNQGETARILALALRDDPDLLTKPPTLCAVVPKSFLVSNAITFDALYEVLLELAEPLGKLAGRPDTLWHEPLVPIVEIDSFSKAGEVDPSTVVDFVSPLDMAEDDIERMIAQIVGQAYRQKDWGGELDDMFSAVVKFRDREVATSFMLKGRGLPRVMKPRDLGTNGDQITRMMTQPAELFVVQHVNRIDPSVRHQLEAAIVARRAKGQATYGSLWDGSDVARLGIAYGFLDPQTGRLIDGTLTHK